MDKVKSKIPDASGLTLWQKLLEIKKAVPYLKKDSKSYEYNYASGTQVLGNINTMMNELGVILKFDIVDAKHESCTYSVFDRKTGQMKEKTEMLYFLTVNGTWINVDKSDEREIVQWYGAAMNGFEKGYGSALTYAERYFMLKQFQIPTDELDPDNFERTYNTADAEPAKVQPKAQAIKPATPASLDELKGEYDKMLSEAKDLFSDKEYAMRQRTDAWTYENIAAAIKSVRYDVEKRKFNIMLDKQAANQEKQ